MGEEEGVGREGEGRRVEGRGERRTLGNFVCLPLVPTVRELLLFHTGAPLLVVQ